MVLIAEDIADVVQQRLNGVDGGVEVDEIVSELVEDRAELALRLVLWNNRRLAGTRENADGLRWEFQGQVAY